MKTKRLGIILGATLLAMTATGCSHFGSFLPPELKDLEINVTPYKALVAGDRFSDSVGVEITGYYSNGKTKQLSANDVSLFFTSDKTANNYSFDSLIPESGSYKLVAMKNGVVSESYGFSAVQDRVFAESIQVEDGNDHLLLRPGEKQIVSFSIAPTNCTEILSIYNGDPSIVSISRLDATRFAIEGLKVGSARLGFSAIANEKLTEISKWLVIDVDTIYANSIKIVTEVPSHMYSDDYFLVSLRVEPSNCNVPVRYNTYGKGTMSLSTYYDEDDRCWFVMARSGGDIEVEFYIAKNATENVSDSFRTYIEPTYARKIEATGENVISIGHESEISIGTTPNNYSEGIECVEEYDHSLLKITKKRDTVFLVTGLKEGKETITFRAKNAEDSYIYCSFDVEVIVVYATKLEVKSTMKTVLVGGSFNAELCIEPELFSAGFSYYSSNKNIATIKKVDDKVFKITGVAIGQVNIWFLADASQYRTLSQCITVNVVKANSDRYGPTIRQTFGTIYENNEDKYAVMPSTGNVKMLVIPVWFSDSCRFIGGVEPNDANNRSEYIEECKNNVRYDIKQAFFGKTSYTGWQTVSSYYKKDSNYHLHLSGEVSNWYNAGMSSGEFIYNGSWGDLVVNAVNWYFNTDNPKAKRTDYDFDGDGYLDGVALIYGSANENNYQYYYQTSGYSIKLSKNGQFWQTARSLSNDAYKDVKSPGPNRYFDASYDNMYTEEMASKRAGTSYSRNKNPLCEIDIRCFCHEIGHMFGLRDLYNKGDNNEADLSGGMTMQACDRGFHDPFSAMAFGWVDPYIPIDTVTWEIDDYSAHHQIILLTPGWNEYNSPFDEYLALELVAPVGLYLQDIEYTYKSLLDGAGIRLYHIDGRLLNKAKNGLTTNAAAADNVAFNNTIDPSYLGGEDCNAYSLDSMYQEYALVHHIRHDDKAGTMDAVDYYTQDSLSYDDLFVQGDTFDFDTYSQQFVKPYLHRINTMNNGLKLGWEFEVNHVSRIRGSAHWTATITLRKTA